jgi:hypothetical protein
VFGIEERYKAKLCGHDEGKAWLVQIIDQAADALMTPTERNRFPGCRQKVNSLWPNPLLLIALLSPCALHETGLRICPSEKSRGVAPFAVGQSILPSPVSLRRIAKNGRVSRISREWAATFLCT